MSKKNVFLLILLSFSFSLPGQVISDFEDILPVQDSVINGSRGVSSVVNGSAEFPITWNSDFGGFWSANWAISSVADDTTSGPGNLYGSIAGGGNRESIAFAVGQNRAVVRLLGQAQGRPVRGVYVTNTTYAHNSMRDGDLFSKQFGGPDGTDPDFFQLIIRGYRGDSLTTDSVSFYLADYRFAEDSLDYLVDDWQFVDLSSLGGIDSLQFTLASSDVGEFGMNTPAFFCLDDLLTYDPATEAGVAADDERIITWATGIDLDRGPTDLARMGADTASAGTAGDALGAADRSTVSLGDGGVATLTFERPIQNEEGADFVVFENGFPSGDGYFLELGFVEVSSDGEQFVRFPATSLTDTSEQVSTFGLLYPEDLRNLAGRFPGQLGTPFDLSELQGIEGLDVDAITHVRIIDVIGSIDPALATFDAAGRPINDPYPTDFPSGGFDLDAVGVIHQADVTSTRQPVVGNLRVWPNPTSGRVIVSLPQKTNGGRLQVFDGQGRLMISRVIQHTGQTAVDLTVLPQGLYTLRLRTSQGWYVSRVMRR